MVEVLCLLDPRPLISGLGLSSISESSSCFVALFRFDALEVLFDVASPVLFVARPAFFWTAGTTALVLPPTVMNVILSPFGRAED